MRLIKLLTSATLLVCVANIPAQAQQRTGNQRSVNRQSSEAVSTRTASARQRSVVRTATPRATSASEVKTAGLFDFLTSNRQRSGYRSPGYSSHSRNFGGGYRNGYRYGYPNSFSTRRTCGTPHPNYGNAYGNAYGNGYGNGYGRPVNRPSRYYGVPHYNGYYGR